MLPGLNIESIKRKWRNKNKSWTQEQVKLLHHEVLSNKIYDWEILAEKIGQHPLFIMKLWQIVIYPQLIVKDKIAGSLRWSIFEDDILINFSKTKLDQWQQMTLFLPKRSASSIEARWKRLCCKESPSSVDTSALNSSSQSQNIEQLNNTLISPYDYRILLLQKLVSNKQNENLQSVVEITNDFNL